MNLFFAGFLIFMAIEKKTHYPRRTKGFYTDMTFCGTLITKNSVIIDWYLNKATCKKCLKQEKNKIWRGWYGYYVR